MVLPGLAWDLVRALLGQERKFSTTEQDTNSVIVEAAEATGGVAQGLDFGVEALGNRVGNGMNNVVEQPLKMAAQHFSDGFELWDAAANHPAVPKVKELLGGI